MNAHQDIGKRQHSRQKDREGFAEIWSVIKCACSANGQKNMKSFNFVDSIIFFTFHFTYIGTLMRFERCVLTMYRNINFKKCRNMMNYILGSRFHMLYALFFCCFNQPSLPWFNHHNLSFHPFVCVSVCACVFALALFSFMKIDFFMNIHSLLSDGFYAIQLLSGCLFIYVHLHKANAKDSRKTIQTSRK